MPVDETVTVKGSPVRSFQKFIELELTPEQRNTALAKLPPEWAKRLQTPVLATEKVPVYLLNRLTEAAAMLKNEPLEQFARRAGREGASEAVRGIYRFFAMVLTPPALFAKGSQMWSSLYNRGELRVDEQTDTSARIALLNFPSELAGCSRFAGWIERMGEMSGAKNVVVRQTQCYSRGAPHCEWVVSWGR